MVRTPDTGKRVSRVNPEHEWQVVEVPHLRIVYLATYREERAQLKASVRDNRTKAEHGLAEAKVSIDRLVSAFSKGLIEESDIGPQMESPRATRDRWAATLALAEDESNLAELHPGAIVAFRRNLDDLASVMRAEGASNKLDEPAQIFREFISEVTIEPRKAGEPYVFEVKGRLAALLGEVSAKAMVARSGLEPPTRGL